MRKVREPSSMIEIEVSQDDVLNVCGVQAKLLNLTQGGIRLRESGTKEPLKGFSQPSVGIQYVLKAEPRVYED